MTTEKYAYLDSQGYVQFQYYGNYPSKIEGLTFVKIDFDLEDAPNQYSKFRLDTMSWVDTGTAEQKLKDQIKLVLQQRERLLVKSDWTALLDVPLTNEKKQEWSIYRQQLRDITSQPGYPFEIQWPKQP